MFMLDSGRFSGHQIVGPVGHLHLWSESSVVTSSLQGHWTLHRDNASRPLDVPLNC